MTPSERYGRVAVVMGGSGAERAVSLDGGRQVLAALLAEGVSALEVDGIPALLSLVMRKEVDRVFNLLHGRDGEDGTIQGALACHRIPVTGSGVLGSACSLNKGVSKRLWQADGLPTASFALLRLDDDPRPAAEELGWPLVVKPLSEGSSVGVSIVRSLEDLAEAVAEARRHEPEVMLEAFVAGGEYTVGILGGEPLPVVRVEPSREFYDYAAKYEAGDTAYHCPSGLSGEEDSLLQELALEAFETLGCEGWGRVDFILTAARQPCLLEANTTPGMTPHSLVPKAAAAAGIGFGALCLRILDTSLGEGG